MRVRVKKPCKRQLIIRSALELIAANGFHNAPIDTLASHAKVSVGSIYRYFRNKDELIFELHHDLQEPMHKVILQDYEADKPVKERFIHLGTALLKYFVNNPLDFCFAEQFLNSPYGIAYRRFNLQEGQHGCDYFRQLFDDGVAQQAVKALPHVVLYSLSFAPLLALARDHVNGFIEVDEQLTRQTVAACWDSVRS